jgi:hypothetical protein
MERFVRCTALFLFSLTLSLSPSSGAGVPAATPTPKASYPAVHPVSLFVYDPGFGKDPFFPTSTRRPIQQVAKAPANTEVPRTAVPDFIILKGFSILREKKLAIINNRTVEEGEEFGLKHFNEIVTVRCVEIKEKTVLIKVNGTTKELQLRRGL